MVTKTEESIQVLTVELAILRARVENLYTEIKPLRDLVNQVAVIQTQMADVLKSDVTKQIAVIQHQLVELAKTRELWGQRGWAVLTVSLSAGFSLVAVILGSLLTFYFNAKR